MSISFQVQSGQRAKEILEWFREQNYRSVSYSDDINAGSRDYVMESRFKEDIFRIFSIFMYFKGENCTFIETDKVKEIIPGKDAVESQTIYEKKLICDGVELPNEV